MAWIIFILVLNSLCWATTTGCFLRIRQDVEFLRNEREDHIDLIKKLLEEIKGQSSELSSSKQKKPKDKWKKFQAAFGGKEQDDK